VETGACWLWNDGRLRCRFKAGAEVTLSDAVECVRASPAVAGMRRLPSLIDLRWLRSQSAEARDYFSAPEALLVSNAVALLVESPLSRAIGNFYLGFNRPNVPTRIFNDEAAALEWLQSFTSKAA